MCSGKFSTLVCVNAMIISIAQTLEIAMMCVRRECTQKRPDGDTAGNLLTSINMRPRQIIVLRRFGRRRCGQSTVVLFTGRRSRPVRAGPGRSTPFHHAASEQRYRIHNSGVDCGASCPSRSRCRDSQGLLIDLFVQTIWHRAQGRKVLACRVAKRWGSASRSLATSIPRGSNFT